MIMLILPIHEHGTCFHLFVSSLISFFSVVYFSEYRSFTSLVRFIPRYFIYLFFNIFIDFAITVVPFPPPTPPHPAHPLPPTLPLYSSGPWVILISSLASTFPTLFLPSPLILSMCYSSSCNPLSSLSPLHSPLTIVRLFLTSMSLVIFCLLFSSVDYVPVKGEIIWYLSLTAWLISLSIMLSSSIHAVAK